MLAHLNVNGREVESIEEHGEDLSLQLGRRLLVQDDMKVLEERDSRLNGLGRRKNLSKGR